MRFIVKIPCDTKVVYRGSIGNTSSANIMNTVVLKIMEANEPFSWKCWTKRV